jgi:catechol 2,3-dioxygenase-like lactoylglutathione lyase family enzyme
MALVLDHIVILVRELEQAIADYTALGFTVQRGGTHADGATHNALVVFADGSYLELIAFLQSAPLHRWARAAEGGYEGFVDFALLPAKVGAVIDAARTRGLAYQGPIAGGRVRPDGARLAWEIGTPPSADLPFLCGDLSARALRVPEGTARSHANGVTGVASLTVAVANLPASRLRYRALLDQQEAHKLEASTAEAPALRSASFTLGPTTLRLATPGPGHLDDTAHALRERLASRGDGLLSVVLQRASADGVHRLPLAQTHGAPFEIHPS